MTAGEGKECTNENNKDEEEPPTLYTTFGPLPFAKPNAKFNVLG